MTLLCRSESSVHSYQKPGTSVVNSLQQDVVTETRIIEVRTLIDGETKEEEMLMR